MLILPDSYKKYYPGIIIPKEHTSIIRKRSRDDKAKELNSGLGKSGYRIIFAPKKYRTKMFYITYFCKYFDFLEERDALEFWNEIHTPGFDPRKYYIDPSSFDDVYYCLTQSLTTTGTNSFTVPASWGPNTVYCVGSGGNGSDGHVYYITGPVNAYSGGGGGGGGYSSKSNLDLARGASITYRVDPAGGAVGTFFNGASLGTSEVGALGGSSAVDTRTGGTGGASSSGTGTTKFSGLNGGTGADAGPAGAGNAASGAGGAAAAYIGGSGTPPGNGVKVTTPTNTPGGNGGSSDVTGGTGVAGADGNPGNNGNDFDGSHGSGSGGAGGGWNTSTVQLDGGAGGLYGAGGGGGNGFDVGTSGIAWGLGGAGKQGMIFLNWITFFTFDVDSTF